MDNNELQHHGIKGMKWGVRRTDAQLARARGSVGPKTQQSKPAAKEEPSKKATSTPAKKSSGDMTNAELKARIERIKLERELTQLTAKEKSAGRKFVEDVLVNAGKQALTSFISGKMTDMLNKKFGGDPKDKGKEKAKPNAAATPADRTSSS